MNKSFTPGVFLKACRKANRRLWFKGARNPVQSVCLLCIGFTACHLPGMHGGMVRWEIDGGCHIDFRLYHVLPVRTLYFYFCIDVRSSPPRAVTMRVQSLQETGRCGSTLQRRPEVATDGQA